MDRFLTTDRCCCGCVDLFTSCLMWAWVDIVGGILMIVGFFNGSIIRTYFDLDTIIFAAVTSFIISGCLIYGIFYKTSILLLPEVICNIIILCSIPIYMLAVVFDEKRDKEDVEHLNHGQSLGRGPAIIVLILSEALMWHKTAVTYSLFKMMQENENENKPSVDADVRVRSNLAPPDPGSSA